MKKVILIDGNNILFRSYYATAYSGNMMKNSKGFPTNALYGLINMLNKIIKEEEPKYIMIAFDKGKTFRHDKYPHYKEGRIAMPDELRMQFPKAKELVQAMGIKTFEIDNYEADDIIGTFAKEVNRREDFIGTIISSDKDLLQLITDEVDVKLLKTNDFIRMTEQTFFDTYGLTPIKMIDIKALMGDPSDNIPGVKGIGEKTALNLLHSYNTLEGVYDNIDQITGKTKEKLVNDKENAFFSKEIATIYCDVPIDINLDNIEYNGYNDKYISLLEELEFYSLIKKVNISKEEIKKTNLNSNYTIISNKNQLKINNDYAIYIEVKGNYHDKNVNGIAIYNDSCSYYIPYSFIKENPNILGSKYNKYTYDLKKLLVSLFYINGNINNCNDDLMISSYLLNYNTKDDISYLMNNMGENIIFTGEMYKRKAIKDEEIIENAIRKAKFIYENKDFFRDELIKKDVLNLYNEIEMPLVRVLASMEYEGINVDKNILEDIKQEVKIKMNILSQEIYNLSGCEFNILSPKQLGSVLFETLQIPYPKKIKDKTYSTSVDILNKIITVPIVKKVLDYRMLAKIYSNYTIGLIDVIKDDNKIHTIFNQTLTRTGRLSSVNPNLQNIPIRTEYGRLVRKAFVPTGNNYILSSDYSQIELRIFAHMSNASNLIEVFNNDFDVHTSTAMAIFHIDKDHVTKEMRRKAKAVNFGILYGISSFGLSEDLGIDVKEAKYFIEHYLETYPGIKDYMNTLIKEAYEKCYVTTLFNRVRILDELKNKNYLIRSQGERMALNTPIQGTSADILKKAMIEVYNEFKKEKIKSKMIIQVHDELVFDVYRDELDKVIDIVKNIMENTIKLKVPLKVEVTYGNNWYEAK